MSKGYRGKVPCKTAEEFEAEAELRKLILECYGRKEAGREETLASLCTILGYSYNRAVQVMQACVSFTQGGHAPETDTQRKDRWRRQIALEARILKRRMKK